jgi:hypothetical protein
MFAVSRLQIHAKDSITFTIASTATATIATASVDGIDHRPDMALPGSVRELIGSLPSR